MAGLSTHVLDQYHGKPAAGVKIALYAKGSSEPLLETVTNSDGRVDAPLLEETVGGDYQLVFSIADYFEAQGVESPFLIDVPVSFRMISGQKYHVPLLVTPWAYSVYRGS